MIVLFRVVFSICLVVITIGSQKAEADANHKKMQILTTIAPIHSLVVGLMGENADVSILSNGASSPHGRSLKPSDLKKIEAADFIVQVGPQLESSLQKTIDVNGQKATLISLMDISGLSLHEMREGGVWGNTHDHGIEEGHDDHHGEDEPLDPHVWLDINNAKIAITTIMRMVSDQYPALKEKLQQRVKDLNGKLSALDSEIKQTVSIVKTMPYLVFHDAYQYFEKRYDLHPKGAVLLDAERQLGAKRVAELHQFVKDERISCVFSEPQFNARILNVLQEDTDLKIATLDPIGLDLERGEALYFELLRDMSYSLVNCLKPKN